MNYIVDYTQRPILLTDNQSTILNSCFPRMDFQEVIIIRWLNLIITISSEGSDYI